MQSTLVLLHPSGIVGQCNSTYLLCDQKHGDILEMEIKNAPRPVELRQNDLLLTEMTIIGAVL